MVRVAYYSADPTDACSFYRMQGVMPYLDEGKVTVHDFSDKQQIGHYHFFGIDTFVFQRPFTPEHLSILKLAKSMGCRLIIDYDDNLLCVPQSNPTSGLFEAYKDTTKLCLRIADEVWVTTESIRYHFSVFNNNIHVIPNAHNDYLFPVEKRKKFNIASRKVAYRGAVTHEVDLYEYLDDLIETINNNENWEFRFIGSRFPHLESKTGPNHTMTNPMPLMHYFKYLREYNPNIFFYPLQNTKFNQGKSNCCFLEATYAGSAFIGSEQLEEFGNSPIFGIGGNLSRVLKIAMGDYEICSSMNDHAWQWILQNRLLSNINKLRERRLCAPKI